MPSQKKNLTGSPMFSRFFAGWSATARIALGQTGMLLTLLLVASFFELIPDRSSDATGVPALEAVIV